VTETGARTKFGHTAELVRTAHVESTQQKTVVRVVRNLAIFNGAIIVLLVVYAHGRNMSIGEIIPLVLTAILASIPVALPATFTLAAALGAKALARLGVLPTRLSAVDEAATLDVLCSDKTGTLTRNELTLTVVHRSRASMTPAYWRWRLWRVPMADRTRGYRDPCCCHESKRGQSVESYLQVDQVRSLRSCNKDLRSDSGGYGRRHAARRERGICGGDQIDRTNADRGCDGARTRSEGFSGSGRCRRNTDDNAAGRIIALSDHRARMRPSLSRSCILWASAW